MARYNPQRRRSGSAAWQWIVIGMVLGFGCSVILVLGALAAGLASLDPNRVANAGTQTPFIITATPQPVTATLPPTLGPPTATMGIQLEVQAPTASPTIAATLLTLQPTLAPTTQAGVGGTAVPPTGGQQTGNTRFARTIAGRSEIVLIAGGTYQMGTTIAEVTAAVQECLGGYGGDAGNCTPSMGEDSYPQHAVTVSAFNLETTEITYAQFLTFLNEMGAGSHRNGCNGQPCMETRNDSETSNVTFDSANYSVPSVISDFPATNVTWYGAQAYCEAIGRRLPTEAEWERAARGDQGFIYPWGNSWDGNRAATRRLADGTLGSAVSVFSLPLGATVTGVYNLAGNIAEWVSDWYDVRYYANPTASIPDPTGPAAGSDKVNRGGSWDTMPFFARTVHRRNQPPLDPTADIGFRCAQNVGAEAPANTSPIGSTDPLIGGSDLSLPTGTPDPATLGTNEEEFNSAQPTVPPIPTQIQPTITLAAGG